MGFRLITHVLDTLPDDVTPADVLIAILLANAADDNTNLAWLSTGSLAQESRTSRRTAQRSIDRLSQIEVIATVFPATNKRPAVYRFPAYTPPTIAARHAARGDILTPQDLARGDILTPQPNGLGATFTTSRGVKMSPKQKEQNITLVTNVTRESAREKTTTSRASRIAEDWQPVGKVLDYARTLLSDEAICAERDKFVDYCLATGKVYASHDAAFRNWVRRAVKDYASSNGIAPRRHLNGASRAYPGWEKVLAYVDWRLAGRPADRKPPKPDDPILHRAVEMFGGWSDIAADDKTRDKFIWAYKDLEASEVS